MQTKKLMVGALVATGMVAGSGSVSNADSMVMDLPQQVIVGGPPGTEFLLGQQPVPSDHQGLICQGELVAQNNSSVHPGNDLRVRSGTSEVLLRDVEAFADKVTPLATPLTLGAEIRVDLVMGVDEIYSGAFRLELQCTLPEQQPPPVPPPPPQQPPTPAPEPPVSPSGGAVAGAGATAVAPAVAPSSAGQRPAVAGPSTPAQLPATGPSDSAPFAVLAGFLLALGLGLRLVARTPRASV